MVNDLVLLLRETRRVEWGCGVKMWQMRISYSCGIHSMDVPVGIVHVLYRYSTIMTITRPARSCFNVH